MKSFVKHSFTQMGLKLEEHVSLSFSDNKVRSETVLGRDIGICSVSCRKKTQK